MKGHIRCPMYKVFVIHNALHVMLFLMHSMAHCYNNGCYTLYHVVTHTVTHSTMWLHTPLHTLPCGYIRCYTLYRVVAHTVTHSTMWLHTLLHTLPCGCTHCYTLYNVVTLTVTQVTTVTIYPCSTVGVTVHRLVASNTTTLGAAPLLVPSVRGRSLHWASFTHISFRHTMIM